MRAANAAPHPQDNNEPAGPRTEWMRHAEGGILWGRGRVDLERLDLDLEVLHACLVGHAENV